MEDQKYCYKYNSDSGELYRLRFIGTEKNLDGGENDSKTLSAYMKMVLRKTSFIGKTPKGFFNSPREAIASKIISLKKQNLIIGQKIAKAKRQINNYQPK